MSTTGVPLTRFDYVDCMMYRNRRLAFAGRLAQQYALDVFSRWQHDNFAFMRLPQTRSTIRVRRNDVAGATRALGSL